MRVVPVLIGVFLSRITGKNCGILSNVSRNFRYWKISCIRIGHHYLPLSFFKVSECRKVLGVTNECFRNTRVSTNFMHREGISLFCVEYFFVSQCRKISWGNHSIYQKNSVIEKIFCIKRRYHCSPLKHLCLIVSTNFAGEPFFVSKKLWLRRFSCKGGGIKFCRKVFCFTGPKNFVGVNSVFQKFSGVDKKLWIVDEGCPGFFRNFLSCSTGNFPGILFNASRNFGYWKLSCIRIGHHYLPLSFFKVWECQIVSWGNYSTFQT